MKDLIDPKLYQRGVKPIHDQLKSMISHGIKTCLYDIQAGFLIHEKAFDIFLGRYDVIRCLYNSLDSNLTYLLYFTEEEQREINKNIETINELVSIVLTQRENR